MRTKLFILSFLVVGTFVNCTNDENFVNPDEGNAKSEIIIDLEVQDAIMEFYGLVTGQEIVTGNVTRGLVVKRQWWDIWKDCKTGRAANCLPKDVVVEAPYPDKKYEDKYKYAEKEWSLSTEGTLLRSLVNSNQLTVQNTYNEEEEKLFLFYKDTSNPDLELVVPIAIK